MRFLTLFLASVHDGWGVSEVEEGNAVKAGDTATMDRLAKEYSYRTIKAHGLAVGLSDGLMGNSEVGYASNFSIAIFHQLIMEICAFLKCKPLEHWSGPYRLARYRPHRSKHSKEGIPQVGDHSRIDATCQGD